MGVRGLDELDVRGRRVFVRVDFNVPLIQGKVSDDTRIREALPTIKTLLARQAKVIIASHLGRPEGQIVEKLRLKPVGERLAELLDMPVLTLSDCVGPQVEDATVRLRPGQIALLENLRFHPGEESNDAAFVKQLAHLADCYVNDAFGTAHRAHASTYGVACRLPSAAGLLLQREVETLSKVIEKPEGPFWAIIGGAKLSDKIGVLKDLIGKVDGFLIGGGVAFTLLKARGLSIGRSLLDEKALPEAEKLMEDVARRGTEILLPVDVRVAGVLQPNSLSKFVPVEAVPSDSMGLDIGQETIKLFSQRVRQARTLLWAGPLGAFETPPFGEGTFAIAKAIVNSSQTFAIIGGGDTASALHAAGITETPNIYVSTGGGATLEFIGGRKLLPIEILKAK